VSFEVSNVSPLSFQKVSPKEPVPNARCFERVLEQQTSAAANSAPAAGTTTVAAEPRAAQAKLAVAPSKTPLSGSQAAEAIAKAYENLVGEAPSQETLSILTSHWSLETGQGERMYNFNFAGIKGRSPEGLSAVLGTHEGFGANRVHIRDSFRAYSSADAGAHDYVSLLQRRYGGALEAARGGEPALFASRLKAGGYYTGNEAEYSRGIVRLANRAMALGMDSLGGTAGNLAQAPQPLNPYFSTAPTDISYAHLNRGVIDPFAFSDALGAQSAMDPSQLVDQVTRAALQIAAEHGA
jgi:flagellum-specific peptidoglycan hydrolase FlgJ